MKFDVVVGNPPYHREDGGGRESAAVPLYDKFVDVSKSVSGRYTSIIIPARWYSGGRGLDDFRETMISDTHLYQLHDFPETKDCFDGLNIRGGVCYFLRDTQHNGPCEVFNASNGVEQSQKRLLKEGDIEVFIRYNQAISILRKVQKFNEETFDKYVSSSRPFGMRSNFSEYVLEKSATHPIKLYRFGALGYIDSSKVTRLDNLIDKYKVLVSKASPGGDDYPHSIVSKPIVSEPNSVCTETYLVIKEVASKQEAANLVSYIKTRFFRFMMSLIKNTQNISKKSYGLVPVQDFSKSWTDAELYKKYSITPEEQKFIESIIRPME